MADIQVQRVHDSQTPRRGRVFLVDGMWPRGVRKDSLALDGWLRDLAPSKELRQWFGHRKERFEGFREGYWQELDQADEALDPLFDAARNGPVTLLYAAKDTEHNNAVVLREYLEHHLQERK